MHNRVIDRATELETPGYAVIATDPDGTVIYWGRGAEKLYGWTEAEALGRDIMELTPGEPSSNQAREIMQALRSGAVWRGEFLVNAKDGTRFLADVTDMPVLDAHGLLIGIVGRSRRTRQHPDPTAPPRRRSSRQRTPGDRQ